MNTRMVQYGVWPNCCNSCDFCLREERTNYSLEQQRKIISDIKENIKTIDWKNDFPYGISLLGGELYYIEDKILQNEFLDLIDQIIQNILLPLKNLNSKYSSVTNGLYNPLFLCQVINKIQNSVGLNHLDLNFSYDLKYRYKNEEDKNLVLSNIKYISQKYKYVVGVQMILTDYLIDYILNNKFNIPNFIEHDILGNQLSLLYPHQIQTGKVLPDFFFSRKKFLNFIQKLPLIHYQTYLNFIYSTKNSATFKYSGLNSRYNNSIIDVNEKPKLANGKQIINKKCGHSVLYQCYSDSDKCMLCDLIKMNGDLI